MMDIHKVFQGFNPQPDGESPVRHRTGVVSVVNADGTVDLDLGGTVVPNVSVLAGASILTGETVQVIAWAGDLLVLGRGATASSETGWQTWAPTYNNITVGSGTVTAIYQNNNELVKAFWQFVMGAGSAFGAAGSELVSLPVPAAAFYSASQNVVGQLALVDAATAVYQGFVRIASGNFDLVKATVTAANITHGAITATVPFTFATGDIIQFHAEYVAA